MIGGKKQDSSQAHFARVQAKAGYGPVPVLVSASGTGQKFARVS